MSTSNDIKIDFARAERIGLDEAILCSGKTTSHIAAIIDQAIERDARLLLTRLSSDQMTALPAEQQDRLDYDAISRTAILNSPHPTTTTKPLIAVVCAGTSDIAVAREAHRTLHYHGEPSTQISDVGVAGLWRLLERLDEIKSMPIVIAVAGMDAALPTVLAGLIPSTIIGVPTSIGYGVASGGQTALNAMLCSCGQGIVATNIDNGFGAACAALRMVRAIRTANAAPTSRQ